MNVGPFALPIHPLIFLASVGVALLVGRVLERGRQGAERAVLLSVLAGLALARLSFVVRYLPDYSSDMMKAFDFRDLGFDPVAGLLAGACMVSVFFLRSRSIRLPLFTAVAAGAVAWSTASAAVNFAHPTATLPTVSLFDDAGHAESLSAGNSMPTVVNLWATWCPPCQAEMPTLAQAQTENPNLRLVFVNQGEPKRDVENYLASHDLHINNSLLDPTHAVAKAVGAIGFPTTLFYDAHGHLLAAHLGPFSKATFNQAPNRFYPTVVSKEN